MNKRSKRIAAFAAVTLASGMGIVFTGPAGYAAPAASTQPHSVHGVLPHQLGAATAPARTRTATLSKQAIANSIVGRIAAPAKVNPTGTSQDGTLSLSTDARVKFGKTVSGSGTLTGIGSATTLTLTRTDANGTQSLPDVAVAADGTFSFSDQPTRAGSATYTAMYNGQDATSATSTTIVKSLPYDLNGDGFADLVVGAPGEDLGAHVDAGMLHVLYSESGGVTATGSVAFDQDSPGVQGAQESDDQFGYSNATGDFNGDGIADVAVSSNTEDVGSTVDAGTVTILFGSPTGVVGAGSQLLNPPAPCKQCYFGESMAVGDFNGDGYDDLAASQAPTDAVYLYAGSPSGLVPAPNFQLNSWNISGTMGFTPALFGFSLSAGDINGDGMADLAIGAPFDYEQHGYSSGAVSLAYGTDQGINPFVKSQRFTLDTAGVPGWQHNFNKDEPDEFGWQVGLGDFNGDGKADLMVTAPGYPVVTSDGTNHEDAGAINEFLSSSGQISTTGARQLNQDTAGMPGAPGTNDYLGDTLAIGDQNGDGKADIAVYSSGDHWVTVVKGASGGLWFGAAVGWNQNSTGIPGSDESEDRWGASLAFENFKGVGPQGMAVGAFGENTGAGAVTVMYSTTSGLTGTGSKYFDQNSPNITGSCEKYDFFGSFFSS